MRKLILIADDNLLGHLLRALLERGGGWDVAGVRDGPEAVLKRKN